MAKTPSSILAGWQYAPHNCRKKNFHAPVTRAGPAQGWRILQSFLFLHCHLPWDGAVCAPRDSIPLPTMSKHNSLKSSTTVGGKRSVLKRFERVKLLKERGEWTAGRSPVGLPKTKHEG